jgi:hypothetical protein
MDLGGFARFLTTDGAALSADRLGVGTAEVSKQTSANYGKARFYEGAGSRIRTDDVLRSRSFR